jgi:NAD(P)H-dependent FMN reductase
MVRIAVILGSVREGRFGDKPAQWIFDELKKRKGVEATFLDLKDFDLPNFDSPVSPAWVNAPLSQGDVTKWAEAIGEQDGFIVVAPEYNRSLGGAMKNAFDWVYPEWNRKAVGFVGYGSTGGARAVEHMRNIAVELQMAPIRQGVHIMWETMAPLMQEKAPVDPARFAAVQQSADTMLDQLVWWASALKAARESDEQRKAA